MEPVRNLQMEPVRNLQMEPVRNLQICFFKVKLSLALCLFRQQAAKAYGGSGSLRIHNPG
jgi:hypothetical protein